MSRFTSAELAPVVAEIRQLIVERLGIKDDFMVLPAVIAEMYGSGYVDSFEAKHAHAFHLGKTMAHVSGFLVHLHAALSAKGHGQKNKFEISSCDRYAAVIPYQNDKGHKLLAFENQNFTYMVLLVPDLMSKYKGDKTLKYAMHVRSMTPDGYGNGHHYSNPGSKGVPTGEALKKHFTDHNGYFCYLDARDRGFVGCIVPEFTYKVLPEGGYDFTDNLVWTGKDAHASIYGGIAMLDELHAYASMHKETFEELEYKVLDSGEVGE